MVHYGRGGSTIALLPFLQVMKEHEIVIVMRRDDDGAALLRNYCSKVIINSFPLTVNNTAMDEFLSPVEFAVKCLKDIVKIPLIPIISSRILAKERPDRVIIGDFPLIMVLLSCFFRSIPTIALIQTSISAFFPKKTITRWLLSTCDYVLGITKLHVDQVYIPNNSKTQYDVVHNTVIEIHSDPEEFSSYINSLQINTEKTVLFLGGISAIKGTLEFVEIALEILKERIDTTFIVAGPFHAAFTSPHGIGTEGGDTEFSAEVFNRIYSSGKSDYFRIIGETKFARDLIRFSSFQMITNAYPHFSRPVIEGWSQRKTTIAARDIFSEYLIDHSVNGLLIDHNNQKAWCDAVHSLLDDPNAANRLGSNGFEKFSREYGPEQTVAKLKTIIKEFTTEGK